jgi:hypothetical protein
MTILYSKQGKKLFYRESVVSVQVYYFVYKYSLNKEAKIPAECHGGCSLHVKLDCFDMLKINSLKII